ncbi:flagellin N-terminal helical domain-containing protein [Agathobacter sp.]|uniref:flagellin N-terminal helical domain-containing protein n=1 Tax=Agathobacter sp. TaxID=2021311 RepID=UPI003FD8D408
MKINRNMSAVRANKQLLGTENRLSKSMRRLSSGYKINSAEDNPAGMAISNKMKAQIEALDQAKSNSSDAQNVMKIADGALNEVSSMLQRMRELAVQGASDTYSENDKKALQSEIDELTKEVDRISGDTEYNTKSLLDGSSDTRVYVRQKDANGNMTQVNSYITRINFSDNVSSDKYELTVDSLATQATGSLASAAKPDVEGTISINGVSVAVKADMTQDEYIQELQKAATAAGTTMQVNGDSISFLSNEYGSDSTVNITLSSSLKALAGADYENADDGSGNMQLKSNGKDAAVTGGENLSDKTIRADGNRVYVVGNSGFSMDFLLSSDMDMTGGSRDLQIDISDIGNMAVQIGANEGQEMKIRIPEVSSQTLYLDTVDVIVKGGADKAMSTLDDAIEYVSGVRSRIGAFQNRLESAESSLSETSENMTGAYSNIMDTDMATEMTEYAAQNILDQAGISVLSQANDMPQQVLSLLSR